MDGSIEISRQPGCWLLMFRVWLDYTNRHYKHPNDRSNMPEHVFSPIMVDTANNGYVFSVHQGGGWHVLWCVSSLNYENPRCFNHANSSKAYMGMSP